MLLTYLDEKKWLAMSPEEQKRQMNGCAPHVERMLAEKKLLAGAPLHPTSTATTVRCRDAISSGFVGSSDLATIEVRPIVSLDGDFPPVSVTP